MELPHNNEISHLDVITTGVESEEVEEVNDAYKDILEELGEHWTVYNQSLARSTIPFKGVARTTEPDIDEMMPSCCPLMILDYIYLHCSNKN